MQDPDPVLRGVSVLLDQRVISKNDHAESDLVLSGNEEGGRNAVSLDLVKGEEGLDEGVGKFLGVDLVD